MNALVVSSFGIEVKEFAVIGTFCAVGQLGVAFPAVAVPTTVYSTLVVLI